MNDGGGSRFARDLGIGFTLHERASPSSTLADDGRLEQKRTPSASRSTPTLGARSGSTPSAREELERAGARFESIAGDGYWSSR